MPAGFYHDKPVAGIGEWIMNHGKIPMAEYQLFAKQFNPVKFNAEEWVKIAKDAGQKYIHIFKWPAGPIALPGVKGQITAARLLGLPAAEPLKFQQTVQAVTVQLPEQAPDKIASVLCLEVKGEVAAALEKK